MADRLLVLIPGYQSSFQRNATLDLLKSELAAVISRTRPAGSVHASQRGGLSGYTISWDGKTTELYELSWQDRVVLLNQKRLFQRMLGGLLASLSWLFSVGVLKAAAANRVWLAWFAVSVALMILWFWGIAAVALVAGGNFAIQLPASLSALIGPVKRDAISWGNWMQGFWLWALVTAALAAIGVKPDFIADMADLMHRYVSGSKSDDPNGLFSLAEYLRQSVYDPLATLPKPGEEVLIVGHSFGALLAVDAVANLLPNRVSLMTLGGVLPFLIARQPSLQNIADKCATSPSLIKWDDYFSSEDYFGSSTPLRVKCMAYNGHDVQMQMPFIRRITLAAHDGYFRNIFVLKALLS